MTTLPCSVTQSTRGVNAHLTQGHRGGWMSLVSEQNMLTSQLTPLSTHSRADLPLCSSSLGLQCAVLLCSAFSSHAWAKASGRPSPRERGIFTRREDNMVNSEAAVRSTARSGKPLHTLDLLNPSQDEAMETPGFVVCWALLGRPALPLAPGSALFLAHSAPDSDLWVLLATRILPFCPLHRPLDIVPGHVSGLISHILSAPSETTSCLMSGGASHL